MFQTYDICSNTVLSHPLPQKLMLIEIDKFNHLISTLTPSLIKK
jgi:hypothetical protein